ncbi:MAG: hypothetical protein FWB78_11835, partial [Treponema sp.]|nr:hypothetical protein [Treponema sp.]
LISCATAPADRPLTAEDRDAVIGNVDAQFQVSMGSSHDVIVATAHVRLLERARLLYGNNVEIRNVEITRRAALGAALMHGEDTIVARGTVISIDIQMARARAGTIEHALREIRRVLPVDARLWVHNGATTDRSLANDTADDITAAFIRDNITVVERGLIDLIALEQGIHLDGTVADSDFISIGNAAGANTIIVVVVAGTGALRRLNVRVLDIATGTVRMQSDTGEAWRL